MQAAPRGVAPRGPLYSGGVADLFHTDVRSILMVLWHFKGATIVRIAESADGLVDIQDLGAKLKAAAATGSAMMIGAFSAASNVTGILVDTDAVYVKCCCCSARATIDGIHYGFLLCFSSLLCFSKNLYSFSNGYTC